MSQEAHVSPNKPVIVEANASLKDPHKYEPVPTKIHIRLLVINAGTGEDVLSGSIKTVNLDAAEPVSFEAISYTWGSAKKDQSILVDGLSLPITMSLEEALLQIRPPGRPRILWADSICINQDDIVEKDYQISSMGRIYTASTRTLICLGLEPHNEDKARDAAALVNDVEAMIEATMRSALFKFECDAFPLPSEDDPLVVDARWLSAWDILIRHPWFERGWVVQEAPCPGGTALAPTPTAVGTRAPIQPLGEKVRVIGQPIRGQYPTVGGSLTVSGRLRTNKASGHHLAEAELSSDSFL